MLNQKITLGDKKRLSTMSGTMWLQYSYIVAICQEKIGFLKKAIPFLKKNAMAFIVNRVDSQESRSFLRLIKLLRSTQWI